MKCNEWRKEISNLGMENLNRLCDAIGTLKGWAVFDGEFKETGIFQIQAMIQGQIRELKDETGQNEIPPRGD